MNSKQHNNIGASIILIKVIVIALCFLFGPQVFAQGGFLSLTKNKTVQNQQSQDQSIVHRGGYLMGYKIENGDTLYVDNINNLYVYGRPNNWKKNKSLRDYYRTVYNFKKVYKYALIAKDITLETDSVLRVSNFSRKEREKYIKQYEKKLFREFEKPLKNLSISQGKLLLKLLDRELGSTSFYVIKGYKGGMTAAFWQGVARLFGSDLKKPYDKYGEDKVVEELVILYQQNAFDNLYYSLFRE